ncbi:MAG: FAD-dependent oxidoreductase [Dokdonella sp.]|uniref:NAD(P)/FAD-dependent oxidoreductase n=1 Tax=Dokdonella sp. TaxID=2291710 RepID=UPI0032673865
MRIAVIGSGIAGLSSAWLLSREHEVVLFESNDYLGGHTHTHDVVVDGGTLAVDTGFIVFNPDHYPLLTRLFGELQVQSRSTTMSFSAHGEASGIEYNAGSLRGLFCQPRNLLRPDFLRMAGEIIKFYRNAPALLDDPQGDVPLGEYLDHNNYSDMFRDLHLVPMASALWSSPASWILEFPVRHLVRFMANHQMLQITGRPPWRVVEGGSRSYVRELRARWSVQERLSCPVSGVRRSDDEVVVTSPGGEEVFDQVVLACHSDQALRLLTDATDDERDILGAMPYQRNNVVLHTDARVLPRNRKAWAAWNAHVPADTEAECTVSYCMNILQSIDAPQPLIVTLNRTADIDPARILWRGTYSHPLQTLASATAQTRRATIQGRHRTWFAGAYWGYGFHEDGIRSGVEVARELGVEWP